MRDWRVKGRDKLDFRASADSIKYHGMYENESGDYRSMCRNTLYIRFKFEIDGLEMRQKACAIIIWENFEGKKIQKIDEHPPLQT